VAAVGLLQDGTVTNHLVNWLTPTKERRIVVTGERGCFVADTITADLTFYANSSVPTEWDAIGRFRGVSEGDMVRYAIPKPEPLALEVAGFITAVQGGDGDVVSAEDGLVALAVAEAMTRAAEQGTVEVVHS
jgi:UDP-N-acetylglucosamine 3-dehydrogenase